MYTEALETAENGSASWWGDVLGVLTEVGWNVAVVAGIVVGGILLSWVLRIIIHRVVNRIVNRTKNKANVEDTQALDRSPLAAVRVVQRTRTLGSILQNIANVTIVVIALLLMVQRLAPDTLGSLTLLTAAVGAGLGFGAQNIVKDVLNGIFIVAEDQIGIGDIVDVGLATGIVEFVSVRVTHVRDANGTLWYVRNGEITRIGNMSQGWSRAIVDVGVPAGSDIATVEAAMLDAANELAKESKWHSRILEHPETWGLETISGDLLVIRVVMKTRATAKDDVTSELKLRLKRAVETLGLTVPSLNSVTLTGNDAAQRVRGANPPRTRPTPITAPPDHPLWRTTVSRPEPGISDELKDPHE
ncbi:small conductance mechanosensitive channel [Microbacterium endophyticum]|uniref:Small conductance mechanosensitive channel n=1 Tax=Microbacterium endophyticum TaxID=1526412 RepID=A0A7W4YMF1_9MICO|nr:mechanosensitive ion channel domain-containing protein [Microbacterium endophyticum]MBB2974576.1 small conductance mechanosensitive channel [Microbacterium endophyticum]NIK36873.1 small conductance mechanosensitive channel [Microbacterium endophyticum]